MLLTNLKDITETGVSHNPEILKKVIIAKGLIPNLMMFGQATFKPTQKTDTHIHPTMTEVFFIEKGKITFIIEGKQMIAKKGDTIIVEANKWHSQENNFKRDVTWLYFGIEVTT